MIRGEALYSSRSAWYVCFPGTSAKDRLTNFKGPGRDTNEMALAERTLTLFSALAEMGINEKAQLMTAGDTARAALREKMSITDEELMSAALAALALISALAEVEEKVDSLAWMPTWPCSVSSRRWQNGVWA